MTLFTRRISAAPRRQSGWLWMAGALCLLAPWTLSMQEESPVGVTREALTRMVQARKLLAEERRDWQLGRELLEDRISLVGDEITILRDKMVKDQANIEAANTDRDKLSVENEALKAATSDLEQVVAGLEARLKALLVQLPGPLLDIVRPFSQALPEDPADTELSLSRRFQNVIAVLEGIDKFHREIQVASEVLALGDGTSAEVTTLYVGIGQAYYVSANDSLAGIGRGGPDGWQWTPNDGIAAAVRAAVEISEGGQVARFVPLPVNVEGGAQ